MEIKTHPLITGRASNDDRLSNPWPPSCGSYRGFIKKIATAPPAGSVANYQMRARKDGIKLLLRSVNHL